MLSFTANGHAVERQAVDLAAPGVEPHGGGPQTLVGRARYPHPVIARRGDALQHLLDHLADIEGAGGVGAAQRMDAKIEERGHGVVLDKRRVRNQPAHERGLFGTQLAF